MLDRDFGERLHKMVLPVPMPHSRGVQVVPTTNGSALLGPDAQVSDSADKGTDAASLQAILRLTEQLGTGVSLDYAIKTYAANRAACDETVRVRPDARRSNLLHVGNRSTGVSASPGTADRVLDLLQRAGLHCPDRPDAVRRLPKVRRLLLDPDPESLPSEDPRYQQVVCVCEQVTAAEIAASFDRHLPPRSIEGIRKRTRATGGRCQGSVCMVGVAVLCSIHTGLPPAEIGYRRAGATEESAVRRDSVAVVGAGVAGLAAAAELADRAQVTVLDRLPVPGGVLPFDFPAIRHLEQQCQSAGVQWLLGTTALRWQQGRLLAAGPRGVQWLETDHLVFAGGCRKATAAELPIAGPRLAGVLRRQSRSTWLRPRSPWATTSLSSVPATRRRQPGMPSRVSAAR